MSHLDLVYIGKLKPRGIVGSAEEADLAYITLCMSFDNTESVTALCALFKDLTESLILTANVVD